jgi:hypothetical protein
MVFQCLAHTVEWEADRWRRLDDIHKLRNRFDYGDIIDVSGQVETPSPTPGSPRGRPQHVPKRQTEVISDGPG